MGAKGKEKCWQEERGLRGGLDEGAADDWSEHFFFLWGESLVLSRSLDFDASSSNFVNYLD